jgi:predicted naringenin-chalcone synthase
MAVYIHDLATAVPPHAYDQTFVREKMKAAFPDDRQTRARIHMIYKQSGIDKRHSVLDDFAGAKDGPFFFMPDESVRSPSTSARNAQYTRFAPAMIADIGATLVNGIAGFGAADITHVITASCTGFFAPGPDYVAVRKLRLAPSTKRFHIGFMGCFAAFQALQVAHSFCSQDPDAVVLVICLELCSLHLQFKNDPDTLVSGALFSDGAAGALVSAREPATQRPVYRLDKFATALFAEGEKDMAWTIGNEGFDLVLSQYVPAILESNVREALAPLLTSYDLDFDDVDLWAVHPGGRAILDRVQSGLDLDASQLDASRRVLANFGNMSSATVLFVLKAMLDLPEVDDNRTVLAMGFGPGLTVESSLLTKLRA